MLPPASVSRADKCCCVWRHASICDFALASNPSCMGGSSSHHFDVLIMTSSGGSKCKSSLLLTHVMVLRKKVGLQVSRQDLRQYADIHVFIMAFHVSVHPKRWPACWLSMFLSRRVTLDRATASAPSAATYELCCCRLRCRSLTEEPACSALHSGDQTPHVRDLYITPVITT